MSIMDMRYIEDITLNHSNPLDNHVFGRLYQSVYADQVLVDSYEDDFGLGPIRAYKHFQSDERRYGNEIVLVAVNRGGAATISLDSGLDLPPGIYHNLLANTSTKETR